MTNPTNTAAAINANSIAAAASDHVEAVLLEGGATAEQMAAQGDDDALEGWNARGICEAAGLDYEATDLGGDLYAAARRALAREIRAAAEALRDDALISEAQLFWDDQDASAAGWWLRYRDADGDEQGEAVEAERGASTEELADAVAALALDATGEIRVYRGGQPRGWIGLVGGKTTGWRAA